jgi:N-acetylglutamate synthase-like GNAT family acetyltransferase
MTETTFDCRVADENDAAAIFDIMQEVASEIPVMLDSPEHQEAMKGTIVECCDSGESWVAVDSDGTVIGFALAKPDRLARFYQENKAVSLRYIGVKATVRDKGVSSALMKKLKAKGEPVTASVLHTNQSAMADRHERGGFEKTGSDENEAKFRWESGDAS